MSFSSSVSPTRSKRLLLFSQGSEARGDEDVCQRWGSRSSGGLCKALVGRHCRLMFQGYNKLSPRLCRGAACVWDVRRAQAGRLLRSLREALFGCHRQLSSTFYKLMPFPPFLAEARARVQCIRAGRLLKAVDPFAHGALSRPHPISIRSNSFRA
jgi:hypothetical protein